MPESTLLIGFVLICGLYMSWNIGANDVANAMGTCIGSGALTLRKAVFLAAIFEFCGAFFFGDHVSKTVEEGILNASLFLDSRTLAYGFIACLVGAGAWLQIASYCAWPVSTTHSIIGALVGFGLTVGGIEGVLWGKVFVIGFGWILTPFLGAILSYLVFTFILRKIIFSNTPLNAARRILPIMAGILASIFAFVFVYDELLQREFNFYLSMGICLTFGLLVGCLAYIYFHRNHFSKTVVQMPSVDNDKILANLDQARHHLKSIRNLSHGDVEVELAKLVDGVSQLKSSIAAKRDSERVESEYSIVEKLFGKIQLLSACLMAFAHGANDVANAIGPLVAAISLLTTGKLQHGGIPSWALFLGGFGIVMGLMTWGWRVIETIGKKLTELTPTRGFAAEFGAATTILIASRLGLPVSATHTLVGAVLGVGMARGIEALNLGAMRNIIISWFVTIPMGAVISVGVYHIISAVFG